MTIEDFIKGIPKAELHLHIVNSDDPAYFGVYVNENYLAITKALNLNLDDIYKLAMNSFEASFLEEGIKDKMLARVREFKMLHE